MAIEQSLFDQFSNSTNNQLNKCLLNNIIFNNWSIGQVTNWTNDNWTCTFWTTYVFNRQIVQLSIVQLFETRHTMLPSIYTHHPNHNGSKPQLIQTTMNPSHRGEGCNKFLYARGAQRPRALATWPSGRRLVRFEPSQLLHLVGMILFCWPLFSWPQGK